MCLRVTPGPAPAGAAFVPFLRWSALIKEWAQLLEHARRVDACRETGRAWGCTC